MAVLGSGVDQTTRIAPSWRWGAWTGASGVPVLVRCAPAGFVRCLVESRGQA